MAFMMLLQTAVMGQMGYNGVYREGCGVTARIFSTNFSKDVIKVTYLKGNKAIGNRGSETIFHIDYLYLSLLSSSLRWDYRLYCCLSSLEVHDGKVCC